MCREKCVNSILFRETKNNSIFCGYLQDKRIHYNPYFIFFEYMMTVLDLLVSAKTLKKIRKG